jgi:hypothetical protein
VIAEGNEQIKEQLTPSVEHLQLHGSASLKGAAASNNKSKIMSSQL